MSVALPPTERSDTTPAPIRVLVADDFPIVRWAIARQIESATPAMTVIGNACRSADTLRLARELAPDVVVLEPEIEDDENVDLVAALVQLGRPRILIYTRLRDSESTDRAMLRGAMGLLHKREPMHLLPKAIVKVHAGELWLDRAASGRLFSEMARGGGVPPDRDEARIATLTRRERVVVAALIRYTGARNHELAERLHMSEHTLRNHLSNIYEKLGVNGRLALFDFARRRGLGEPA